MATALQPAEHEIDLGARLLEAPDEDAFSFLGIQAESLELADARAAQRRSVPPWSNDLAVAKVLSGQRASKEELLGYFHKGVAFAKNMIGKLETQLRGVLCEGAAVRKEISGLQDNTKEVIRYVASLVVGVLATSLPGAVTVAITSIATTLAVILIKKNLSQFCAIGAKAVE
jgi:hypothetical protein